MPARFSYLIREYFVSSPAGSADIRVIACAIARTSLTKAAKFAAFARKPRRTTPVFSTAVNGSARFC
ncbi:hypothetical protein [Breoghania sp. JC706]|uniref:hypothetical protein n=1 Tax=Breoghania sp. JC706 TaxID=3117732 RepID=UPI003008F59B